MTEYPTLMFYKSGTNSGVIHRGYTDWEGLEDFLDEQMSKEPTKIKVTNEAYLARIIIKQEHF